MKCDRRVGGAAAAEDGCVSVLVTHTEKIDKIQLFYHIRTTDIISSSTGGPD